MIGDEPVRNVLSDETNHYIRREENGGLIGISVINENTVYLLLVDGEYQRQGMGSSLLKESEEFIKSKGFDKVTLGVGKDYIVPGVPMNRTAHLFFEKHGYRHSWGDEKCIDLSISLSDFIYTEHKLGDTIDGNLYRIANESDRQRILQCCKDADSDFVEYYNDDNLYTCNSSDPVIIAEKDFDVRGALMIGTESEEKSVGYAGCIITAPRHRNKGIATNLMKIGTSRMKDMGLKNVWLSYTYTAVANIYSKIGYNICMEYFMGENEEIS